MSRRRSRADATAARWIGRAALRGVYAAVAVAGAGCETLTGDTAEPVAAPPVEAAVPGTLELAEQAVAEERYADARRLLDRVLVAEPGHARARLLAAELLLAQGSPGAAAAAFAALAESPDVGAPALQGRGIALMLTGDASLGYRVLRLAVARDPGLWRAWNALGYYHDQRVEWRQSAESYARALAANPESALIYNNRGYSMLMQRRLDEAHADLTRALRIDPDFTLGRDNLRLVFAWQGKYAQALSGLAHEDEAKALNNVGFIALLRGEYMNAEAFLLRAMEVDPSYNETASRNLAYLNDLRRSKMGPARSGSN